MRNLNLKPERRDARRERLKYHVPPLYRPVIHFGCNLLVACLAIFLVFQVSAWTQTGWGAWLALPFGLVFGNAAEYLLHRFPMHRRYPLFKRAFRQHTVLHHRFFTHRQIDAHERRDYFFVLFPIVVGLGSLASIGVLYLLSWMALGVGFASILAITLILYVLALDGVHLLCHLPLRHFEPGGVLAFAPLVYLHGLHRRHHDPKLMREVNFNITFPLVDWWFGTLDDGRQRHALSPRTRFWSRVTGRGEPA